MAPYKTLFRLRILPSLSLSINQAGTEFFCDESSKPIRPFTLRRLTHQLNHAGIDFNIRTYNLIVGRYALMLVRRLP